VNYLIGLTLNLSPPDLSLPSSEGFRCEPPVPGKSGYLQECNQQKASIPSSHSGTLVGLFKTVLLLVFSGTVD
jgi:hypothetical protein